MHPKAIFAGTPSFIDALLGRCTDEYTNFFLQYFLLLSLALVLVGLVATQSHKLPFLASLVANRELTA
jgi:hypothetical protein